MNNLNLLYNKLYYSDLGKETFPDSLDKWNKKLFGTKFASDDYRPSPVPGVTSFRMKTAYPGLLIGTGYAHGTGEDKADADLNCGFSFDYVTGQPYIPGSSVKGVLSSCFRYPEVIESLLPKAAGKVPELKASIFGVPQEEYDIWQDETGVDVFFDAVLCGAPRDGKVMGGDYITPHSSITSDPTPIFIPKVLPGVIFEFRFLLADSVIGGTTVAAEEKRELFITLLGLFGIGAKTNVGYGILEEIQL